MSKYRKVDVRIWNDEKFRSLSASGKLIFLFIMTHPGMTALGAMRATLPGLEAELGTLPEGFGIPFQELVGKGLVEHDSAACFVGMPNFLKYNGPENPNVVKSWMSALDLIPECALKDRVLWRGRLCAETLGEGYAKGLPEPFRKGMPKQEQEPEQEPEPKIHEASEKPKKEYHYYSWITSEGLADPAAVLEWHSRVSKLKNSPLRDTDISRVNTLAAAALSLKKDEPIKFFVWCVKTDKFKSISQAAEDAAHKTLKELRRNGDDLAGLFGKVLDRMTPDDVGENVDDEEGER